MAETIEPGSNSGEFTWMVSSSAEEIGESKLILVSCPVQRLHHDCRFGNWYVLLDVTRAVAD
jgi:hypothetical protein